VKTFFLLLLILSTINAKQCDTYLIKKNKHKAIYKEINRQIKNCEQNTSINIISKDEKINVKNKEIWNFNKKKKSCYIKIDKKELLKIDKEINIYRKKNKCKKSIIGIFENNKIIRN